MSAAVRSQFVDTHEPANDNFNRSTARMWREWAASRAADPAFAAVRQSAMWQAASDESAADQFNRPRAV
jgi:hypothetical protein